MTNGATLKKKIVKNFNAKVLKSSGAAKVFIECDILYLKNRKIINVDNERNNNVTQSWKCIKNLIPKRCNSVSVKTAIVNLLDAYLGIVFSFILKYIKTSMMMKISV